MIDLASLQRARLHRGTLVHAIRSGPHERTTACGKNVRLETPTGRPYDRAMPADIPITCPTCQRSAH